MTTVAELVAALSALPPNEQLVQVKVWLPGSKISIEAKPFLYDGYVCLEGNVDEGSALSMEGQ